MSTRLDPVKEAAAVQVLRSSMAAVDPDDEVLMMDMIEGETNLFEALDVILSRISVNNAMIFGIDEAEKQMSNRRDRFKKRIEADRALIEQAMMIAELDKIERPTATLSLSKRAPKAEITEEADIPAEFFKPQPPKLDRKAVLDALREGREVRGAYLSNAAPSLTIRSL